MDMTNDAYTIVFYLDGGKKTERYFRDKRSATDSKPWVKISTRGNEFRASAEQVLNHLLPALAIAQERVRVEVEYHPGQSAREAAIASMADSHIKR